MSHPSMMCNKWFISDVCSEFIAASMLYASGIIFEHSVFFMPFSANYIPQLMSRRSLYFEEQD
jgi:hypothetical protein